MAAGIQHYADLEKLGEVAWALCSRPATPASIGKSSSRRFIPTRLAMPIPAAVSLTGSAGRVGPEPSRTLSRYTISVENGVDFIVMEYVSGQPMDTLLLGGPVKPEMAVKYGMQIADALSAAHHAGIVHRDLKPGNIVISQHGCVKLLDFGLAKLTDSSGFLHDARSAVTAEGCIVGTAAYMAPEQALGKPVDSRTDLFSLGAVLYEMLLGRRAFEGDSAISMLTAVLRDEPTDICVLNRDVPKSLADVVYRCLKKHPEERYESAADLKADLEKSLLLPAPPPPTGQPTVAVTPFQDFTTEGNDFFAQGLMQEIAAAFAVSPGLRVVPKTARNATSAVLEGSVRKSGGRVRVMAQLVDPLTTQPIWAERFDRELTDLFKTQEELADRSSRWDGRNSRWRHLSSWKGSGT